MAQTHLTPSPPACKSPAVDSDYCLNWTQNSQSESLRAGIKIKVFVQRPGSTEEEDGVLVFVCLGTSQENTTTYFVVLNPDLEELGRFSAPFPTPLGFHGIWV